MLPAWLTDTVTPDLARAVRYTLLWGLEGVALRSVGGQRVPDGNEAALRRRLDEADLPVVLLDPGLFEGALGARAAWLNDTDALADTLAFAQRVGCPLVGVGALAAEADGYTAAAAAEALRPAVTAATRAGVRLAIRNERGTAVETGAALAAVLDALGDAGAVGDWRPADALAAGEAAADGWAAAGRAPDRLGAVTVTDAWLAAHDAAAWLRPLRAAGWQGPVVLHVEGRPAGPAGLAAATALVGALRRAR